MSRKKIIFFINSLSFFISHRINIAEKVFENNIEVIIVAKKDLQTIPSEIKKFKFIDINIRDPNFFTEIKNIQLIKKIIQEHKPSFCHFITVKSIFYAAIIKKSLQNTNVVLSFSGIGSIASNKKILSFFSKIIFFSLLKNIRLIFQNYDDQKLIMNYYNFPNHKSYIIHGSGVDLEEFSFKKIIIKENLNFLFASRLLLDKGLLEFIKASQKILDNGFNATFTIIGELDKSNPSKINLKEIHKWIDDKNKFFYAYRKDVKKFIEYSDVVVLPSYREGFPKILIEASAVGRAILTTRVPGCKDCVNENVNGILVNPKDYLSLYEGMNKILNNKDNLERMSYHSRKIAEKKYDINSVNKKHIMIYNSF